MEGNFLNPQNSLKQNSQIWLVVFEKTKKVENIGQLFNGSPHTFSNAVDKRIKQKEGRVVAGTPHKGTIFFCKIDF